MLLVSASLLLSLCIFSLTILSPAKSSSTSASYGIDRGDLFHGTVANHAQVPPGMHSVEGVSATEGLPEEGGIGTSSEKSGKALLLSAAAAVYGDGYRDTDPRTSEVGRRRLDYEEVEALSATATVKRQRR